MDKEKIITKQQTWHAANLQGCLYAGYVFRNQAEEFGLARFCLSHSNKTNILSQIVDIVNQHVSIENNFIVSIIVPYIKTLEHLLDFIELSKKTKWVIEHEFHDNFMLVKIRVPIGLQKEDNTIIYSWMLGFGPFSFFPKTRQSPYFEILVSTKSKKFLQEKFHRTTPTQQTSTSMERGGTLCDAHVADIFIKDVTNNESIDINFWVSSLKKKARILSNNGKYKFDDFNAKAKITFSYPI